MIRLRQLRLEDYQHPNDKAAFAELSKKSAFKKAVDWIVKNTVEDVIKIQNMGSGIKVNANSYPVLYNLFMDVARTISLENTPELFMKWAYNIYATTDGDSCPKTVINSGVTDLLTTAEQRFLFGHECGHIKSQHLKFLLVCRYWCYISPVIPGSTFLQVPLFYWSRQTDLTADRVGLLACQDINAALTTMIKMAGAPKSMYDKLDVDAFIKQAEEFSQNKKQLVNNLIEKLSIMDNRMPWLVNRAAELLTWYRSGEYDAILRKYGV